MKWTKNRAGHYGKLDDILYVYLEKCKHTEGYWFFYWTLRQSQGLKSEFKVGQSFPASGLREAKKHAETYLQTLLTDLLRGAK